MYALFIVFILPCFIQASSFVTSHLEVIKGFVALRCALCFENTGCLKQGDVLPSLLFLLVVVSVVESGGRKDLGL